MAELGEGIPETQTHTIQPKPTAEAVLLENALRRQKVQDRFAVSEIGTRALGAARLLEPDLRYHLSGDKLGIFRHPDSKGQQDMGIFFEGLLNSALNLSERIHRGEYMLGQNGSRETNSVNDLVRRKAGSDIGEEAGKLILAGADSADNRIRDPEQTLARLEDFLGLSALTFELAKLTDIPSDDISKRRALKSLRHGFDIASGATIHLPGTRFDGKSVKALNYNFEAPAVVDFKVLGPDRKPDLVFSFVPMQYTRYPGHHSLDDVPLDEGKEILHERARNLSKTAEIDEVLEAAKATSLDRGLTVSLMKDDQVVSQVNGQYVEGREDGAYGFILKAKGFPEYPEFYMRGKASQQHGQGRIEPMRKLVEDFSKLSVKPEFSVYGARRP